MAYCRTNFLKTVIAVQQLVQLHKRKGVSQKWVFDHIIDTVEYPLNISYGTFRKYMCINAKHELKQITNEKD